jgi:dihydrofolate reductase
MITFYTAASLDGYIARNDGSIDWLCGGNDSMEDYSQFIAKVDCLVMGRSTYDKVLGFGQWPYAGKPCYVMTHTPPPDNPYGVEFVSEGVEAFLKAAPTKFNAIWLVGGAKLTEEFLKRGLIDEFNIFIMPLLLGDGIPLFPKNSIERRLVLKAATRMEQDCIKLTYANG